MTGGGVRWGSSRRPSVCDRSDLPRGRTGTADAGASVRTGGRATNPRRIVAVTRVVTVVFGVVACAVPGTRPETASRRTSVEPQPMPR